MSSRHLPPQTLARIVASSAFLWVAGGTPDLRADEGQWRPSQISELAIGLRNRGLKLEARDLWNPDGDERTGGLMRAAVNFSGCSAAFVSPDGLILTNHHCAYGALQAQSSVEKDLLTQGFLAKTRGEELEAKGRTIRILRSILDVTDVLVAARDGASEPVARAKAMDLARKKLVSDCEGSGPGLRCQVASYFGGSAVDLLTYVEIRDVRLVYAPPKGVGEFGGEVDNWMWPRHTGDFAFLRAWVGPDGQPADHAPENVPYKSSNHLPMSTTGVEPGQMVAVLGYPGNTDRYLPGPELQRRADQVLRSRIDLFGEWLQILESASQKDPKVAIQIAAVKKNLANVHKNARGTMAGFDRSGIVDAAGENDAPLLMWGSQLENKREYGGTMNDLGAISMERRNAHDREFLLTNLGRGLRLLPLAVELERRARESGKPDAERVDAYMDRNAAALRKQLEQRARDAVSEVEIELLASVLSRAASLPAEQKIAAFDAITRGRDGDRDTFRSDATKLIERTRLKDPATVLALFDEPARVLRDRDPLFVLARGVADALEALERTEDERRGKLAVLEPKQFDIIRGARGGTLYPDANGTLRASFAVVKGYSSPDATVVHEPKTKLAEAIAKHTGKEPFSLPARVVELAPAAPKSYWSDPALGDVPLCFLSDADTTGGNSGSAVINGNGELVGVNFDRVWETVGGDYGYSVDFTRNIVLDVRFILWMLDAVEDADALLDELGVTELRGQPAREAPAALTPAAAQAPLGAESGCSCSHAPTGGSGSDLALLPLLALVAIGRRRAQAEPTPAKRAIHVPLESAAHLSISGS